MAAAIYSDLELEGVIEKRMGATNVGVRRAHPFFVVTVLTPATT